MEISKGKWEAGRRDIVVPEDDDFGHFRVCTTAAKDALANNVANETGLMPRELLKQRDDLLEVCEKCVQPLLAYTKCLSGYAKESFHKGNRGEQSYWNIKTGEILKLQREVNKAIAETETK